MSVLNGYTLTTEWQVVGGMSEIAFASKGGKDWFIKKFISPKYPTPDSPGSERIKLQKKKNCEEFEKRQKELNGKIGSKCGLGGNLVYAVDFFRVGPCYYKINEKIDASSMSISDISHLNHKDLLIIMKSLAHSLRIMHRENIVHGDLKPDNILIKATTTGTYTTKLIDFDDSYFSGNPPKDREQVVGTPEYYSPELFDYISDEDAEMDGSTLTIKSDIFALGIIFCEYLTGEKPILPDGYNGTYSAVRDGKMVSFCKSIHLTPYLQDMLYQMLQLDSTKRPTIDEIFTTLKNASCADDNEISLSHTSSECKIIRFIKTPSIKVGFVSLEWDVENAKEIRINGGLPLPKRGKKDFSIQEKYALKAISISGKVVEKLLVEDTISPKEEIPDDKTKSGLRGSMLKKTGLR